MILRYPRKKQLITIQVYLAIPDSDTSEIWFNSRFYGKDHRCWFWCTTYTYIYRIYTRIYHYIYYIYRIIGISDIYIGNSDDSVSATYEYSRSEVRCIVDILNPCKVYYDKSLFWELSDIFWRMHTGLDSRPALTGATIQPLENEASMIRCSVHTLHAVVYILVLQI